MQPENQQQSGNWVYNPEDQQPSTQSYAQQPEQFEQSESQAVTWTASEFIAHHKDRGWYLLLTGGFLALCGLIYLFTKDIISIVAISIVFILFMILGGSKPQQRTYSIDRQGITIDQKFYPYNLFKSFDATREGAIGSITFMPLKRIMPELSVYFAPEDEDKIVNVLITSLPNQPRTEKVTDRLMKRLRF